MGHRINEYDINFELRKALADFIMECTHSPLIEEAHGKEWMLFVEGESSAKGCRGRDSVHFPRKGELRIHPSLHLSLFKQRRGVQGFVGRNEIGKEIGSKKPDNPQ